MNIKGNKEDHKEIEEEERNRKEERRNPSKVNDL